MKSVFATVASVLVLLTMLGEAPPSFAQDTNLVASSVTACGIGGTVTLTIAGITTVTPIDCVSKAYVDAPGRNQEQTASVTVGVPGIADVAELSALTTDAQESVSPNTTSLSGSVDVTTIGLINNAIVVNSINPTTVCNAITGDTTLQCKITVAGLNVSVAGKTIPVPNPVPPNFSIPLPNIGIVVSTPLGAVSVPASGTLLLNGASASGIGTTATTVDQDGMQLILSGNVTVAGLGLINVTVNVVESQSFELETASPFTFSSVVFQ